MHEVGVYVTLYHTVPYVGRIHVFDQSISDLYSEWAASWQARTPNTNQANDYDMNRFRQWQCSMWLTFTYHTFTIPLMIYILDTIFFWLYLYLWKSFFLEDSTLNNSATPGTGWIQYFSQIAKTGTQTGSHQELKMGIFDNPFSKVFKNGVNMRTRQISAWVSLNLQHLNLLSSASSFLCMVR